MGFNVSDYEGSFKTFATVKIGYPETGEETGLEITVLSPNSELCAALDRDVMNRAQKFANQNNRKLTEEECLDDAIRGFALMTLEWKGMLDNGKPVPFSVEAACKLYKKFPFIRDQVNAFTGNPDNFRR